MKGVMSTDVAAQLLSHTAALVRYECAHAPLCGSGARRAPRHAHMRRLAASSVARAARGGLGRAPGAAAPSRAFIKLPGVLSHEQTFAKRKTVPYTPQQARARSTSRVLAHRGCDSC
jgi:hypothetical protein